MSVLSGHVIGAGARMGSYKTVALPTGAGVDLFFAISGFIMVYASDGLFTREGAALQFLQKRVLRLVPLYWLCTTAMLAMMLAGRKSASELPDLSYVLSSYLFIPDTSYASVDGVAFPLLSLGWTLNFEMLFYAIFSVFIGFPRGRAVAGVAATLMLVVVLGTVLTFHSAVLHTWTQAIILEFALGMLVAHAFLQGARWPVALRIAALAGALVWLAMDPCALLRQHQTPNSIDRVIGWGMPAALILAAAVLGSTKLPRRTEKVASLLGDSSYSLYLTHPFVLITGQHIWMQVVGPHHTVWFILATIAASVAVSIVVHALVERPLGRSLARVVRSGHAGDASKPLAKNSLGPVSGASGLV